MKLSVYNILVLPFGLRLARHFHGRWEENNDRGYTIFSELIDLTSLSNLSQIDRENMRCFRGDNSRFSSRSYFFSFLFSFSSNSTIFEQKGRSANCYPYVAFHPLSYFSEFVHTATGIIKYRALERNSTWQEWRENQPMQRNHADSSP